MTLAEYRSLHPNQLVIKHTVPPMNRAMRLETLCATIGGHPHLNRRVLFRFLDERMENGCRELYAVIDSLDCLIYLGVLIPEGEPYDDSVDEQAPPSDEDD